MKLDFGICTVPVRSEIILSGGTAERECGEPATVCSFVPVVDRRTGAEQIAEQWICLEHSINLAVWKLIQRMHAAIAEQRKSKRLISLG